MIQVEQFTHILNSAPSRHGRPKLDVHNIIYWFKNTRAAMRRTELRLSRQMKMFDCDPVGIHEYVDNFFLKN